MRLIFLIILFGVGYLLYHLYGKKLLKQGPSGLIKPVLILLAILLVLGVLTGRAHAIFALLGGLFAAVFRFAPLLFRFYPQIRTLLGKFGYQTSAGPGHSRVNTETLSMTLDHQSGRIDGEIIAGQFKGHQLSSLSLDEIKTYYSTCATQDPEALRLIEAFVQREYPEAWESGDWNSSQSQSGQSHNQSSASGGETMSVHEAQDILGLPAGASKQEINYAHRKLMTKLHPDRGGSTWLATRVNQAKDLLLNELNKNKSS